MRQTLERWAIPLDEKESRTPSLNCLNGYYILGLATDYCVKFTALDAAAEGFQVYLIEDACRGVDLRRGDVSDALTEMKAAGVTVIKSSDVMKLLAASSLAPGEGS